MQPQAPSDFPDAYFPLLIAALLAFFMIGCTGDEFPDRDPLVIERAPVDSLEFLPVGSRYLLQDSLSQVRFRGYHLGYVCTEITVMDLEKRGSGLTPAYAPRLKLKLPAKPTCALDSVAGDTVLLRRFTAADSPTVRLVDSAGGILDTANLVRGTLLRDSLELVAPAISVFHGRFFYQDTSGALQRRLMAEPLTSCEHLNHAEFRKNKKGDTTRVVFTWVLVDSAASPDSCMGPAHADDLVPVPAISP